MADGGEEELAKKVPEEIDYKGEKEGTQYTRNISTIDEKSCGKEIVEVEVLNQSME